MTDFDSMSDGEISWNLHLILKKVPKGHATICLEDYCNEWSDGGPLISEYGISLVFDGAMVEASIEYDGIIDRDGTDESLSIFNEGSKDKALRVAMITLLEFLHLNQ